MKSHHSRRHTRSALCIAAMLIGSVQAAWAGGQASAASAQGAAAPIGAVHTDRLIVKYRDEKTDARTELEAWLR